MPGALRPLAERGPTADPCQWEQSRHTPHTTSAGRDTDGSSSADLSDPSNVRTCAADVRFNEEELAR